MIYGYTKITIIILVLSEISKSALEDNVPGRRILTFSQKKRSAHLFSLKCMGNPLGLHVSQSHILHEFSEISANAQNHIRTQNVHEHNRILIPINLCAVCCLLSRLCVYWTEGDGYVSILFTQTLTGRYNALIFMFHFLFYS